MNADEAGALDIPLDWPPKRDSAHPLNEPPVLDRLREEPIRKVRTWDGSEHWVFTRYEDVREILRDPRVSSDSELPGFPHVSAGSKAGRKLAKILPQYNGAEHQHLRRLLTPEFTIKRMDALRPRIEVLVAETIDAMLDAGPPLDLVESFALVIPSAVISVLLGVPYEDHAFFQERGNLAFGLKTSPEDAAKAHQDLLDYLDDLITRKEKTPGDDLISRLIGNWRQGEIERRDILNQSKFMLIAGFETTAGTIEMGVLQLLNAPDQRARFMASLDDRAAMDNAVEEILRIASIISDGRRRIALEDIEFNGVTIRAGDGIIASTQAANHDPRKFNDPTTFDIGRNARAHVAFGFGPHQCLGQPLARAELRIALPALFSRIPDLALAAPIETLPFRHELITYGVMRMPVTWGEKTGKSTT